MSLTNEEYVERALGLRRRHPEWSHGMVVAATLHGEHSTEFALAGVRRDMTMNMLANDRSVAGVLANVQSKQAIGLLSPDEQVELARRWREGQS